MTPTVSTNLIEDCARASAGYHDEHHERTGADVIAQISSSIQGAHAVAATMPAQMAQVVVDTANSAFVAGITQAMFIGAVISGMGALLVFLALPTIQERTEAPAVSQDRQAVSVAGD